MITLVKAVYESVAQWREGNSETPFRLVRAFIREGVA